VLGVDLALNEVSARLVAPTHTLYVRTEHAVRVARLAERGVLEHDRPTFDLAIAGRLEAAYLGLRDDRLAGRWWTVDSTHKSAEALAMTLASRLSRSSARAVRVA
jgi:thymidylate kinase